MAENHKAVVNLATGLEDAERVTCAFLVAVAALEQGKQVAMFLTKEAVRLALPGYADAVACEGCPPLAKLSVVDGSEGVERPTLPVTGPSGLHSGDRDRLIRRAKALSWLSLAWMTVEGSVAITAALVAGSVALLGFGIDSAIEGLAAVIVIWRFTGARRLSEQAERRAQKAVAISFFLLAPYIAQDAIRALIAGEHPSTSWIGIGLSVSSIVAMPLLGRAKQRVGQRLGSPATAGEGAQNLLCAYMAAGVLAGLAANAAVGWWWLDPVVALAIAAIAVREGRKAWTGEGCACVAVPGVETDRCQHDCC